MCRLDKILFKLKNKIQLNEEEYSAMINELNANIKATSLPKCYKGQVFKKKDKHLILINNDICEEKKRLALIHELEHIINEDFESDKSLSLKEGN